MGTHEVGQVELVIGGAHKEWTALRQTRHRLTRDVIVGNQTTAVGVTFQGVVVKLAVYFVHVDGHTQQLLVFLKQVYPGVQV